MIHRNDLSTDISNTAKMLQVIWVKNIEIDQYLKHSENTKRAIYILSGISWRTVYKKGALCGSVDCYCCCLFQSRHLLASPSALILLIITSVLDIKWRTNSSAIQVTFRVLWFFEGCQTSVFHLKNQQLHCTKGEQDKMREKGSFQGLEMNKWRLWGLFVITFPLRSPVREITCASYSVDSWASVKHPEPEEEWEEKKCPASFSRPSRWTI